jgi:phosphate transport system substrate-binding protein
MSGTPPAEGSPSGPPPPVVRRASHTMLYVAIVVVLVIVVAGVAVAYEEHWIGAKSKTATCGPVTLQGDGAQIATPLVDAWAQAFASQTGNQVNYPGAGSGTGITHFTSASIDFAIADNPLSSAESSVLPSPALTLPVTGSAITIVYNLPNLDSTHLDLNGAVLTQIWTGTVTNWNDSAIQALNPGVSLPNATIKTVDRSGSAGTTYVFTSFLSQENRTWNTTVGYGLSVKFPAGASQTAQSSNSALLSIVNSTQYTISYSDLTDVENLNSKTIGYAAIENPSGAYITPTLADTSSAIADRVASLGALPTSAQSWYNVSMINAKGTGDYPLATFIYLYVYQATDKGFAPSLVKSQVLVQWLDWVVSTTEGQSYVSGANLYYPTLPNTVLQDDMTGIGTLTYNGASIPSC